MAHALPEVDHLAANVLEVYRWANVSHRREGMAWYGEAHDLAVRLAAEHGATVEQAAGVIAALSPRLSWSLNVAYAERFLATGDAPVLGRSKAAATRILNGESPLDVLNGPKTRAFFANILEPQSSSAVTIDGHAFDLAYGEHSVQARGLLSRNGAYDLFAQAYHMAAEQVGIRPLEMQAITWTAQREIRATRRAA